MPFFIYGSDAETGVVARRIYSEAETDADAHEHGAAHGLVVTAVVPCREDQNPKLVAASTQSSSTARRLATQANLAAEENRAALDTFRKLLQRETPTTYITYGLIAINVFVFVAMVISGVSAISPENTDLILWGSESGMYTVRGEWWRVFTAMFVHIGFLHLLFNMCAFGYIGQTVERMFGNLGFLMLYIVSGLGGGVLALYLNPMQIHAGASGAIFGVYGALLAALLTERDSIPPQVSTHLKNFVIVFIVYNLITSMRPGISMAAHVGGLVVGFICGGIAAQPLKIESQAGRPTRNLIVAGVGVMLFAIGIVSVNDKYPNLDHMQDFFNHFDAIEKKTHETFRLTTEQNVLKLLTRDEFADSIERDMLPDWRTTRDDLDTMPTVKSKTLDSMRRYLQLRQEALEAMSTALRGTDKMMLIEAQGKLREADKLSSWATATP